MGTSSTHDQSEPQRTFASLKELPRDQFKAAIKKNKDDDLLADLRYEFGWDPDPRKSSWQTRDINRELTRRKDWRAARPQWIGIAFSTLLSLAALIVAIVK